MPSNAGGVGSIPGWGATIPHASQPKKTKTQNRSNVVTNSIKTLKNGPHQKKKSLKIKKQYGIISNSTWVSCLFHMS